MNSVRFSLNYAFANADKKRAERERFIHVEYQDKKAFIPLLVNNFQNFKISPCKLSLSPASKTRPHCAYIWSNLQSRCMFRCLWLRLLDEAAQEKLVTQHRNLHRTKHSSNMYTHNFKFIPLRSFLFAERPHNFAFCFPPHSLTLSLPLAILCFACYSFSQ